MVDIGADQGAIASLAKVKIKHKATGGAKLVADLVRVPRVRRAWILRIRRPANLFQPHNDTSPNRYPEVFTFLRDQIDDGSSTRLLSFGCSVGDEVFSLRHHFTTSFITGIDISRGNIADCERKRAQIGDDRMEFTRASGVEHLESATLDAVMCMAVFRHGDLSARPSGSCAHRISFTAFDHTVAGLARCLKIGGLLVIEHSNFRFCDAAVAAAFEVVGTRDRMGGMESTPLFGPDNLRLTDQSYRDFIFRKVR